MLKSFPFASIYLLACTVIFEGEIAICFC